MRHYQFFTLDFLIMSLLNLPVKACIRYILLIFFIFHQMIDLIRYILLNFYFFIK